MNKILIFIFSIFFGLLFTSCSEKKAVICADVQEEVERESGMKLPSGLVKIGELSDCFDTDCIKTVVFKLPIGKRVDFERSIDLVGDSLSSLGYWRKEGEFLRYKPTISKKSIFVEMEYSTRSNVLIIGFYNI